MVGEMSEENGDRRNDVGQKLFIGIVLSGFGIVLGVFINSMVMIAGEGRAIALENKSDIVGIKANYDSISKDLDEIKGLLARRVPFDQATVLQKWRVTE